MQLAIHFHLYLICLQLLLLARHMAQFFDLNLLVLCIHDLQTQEQSLTENQRVYYDILKNNQITICSGPAGVGKSYIAMKAAVDLLQDPTNSYEKIMIVRPAVEAEEKLGSLPGALEEKLDPYISPSYYLLNKLIGKENREKLIELDFIEVQASAYLS